MIYKKIVDDSQDTWVVIEPKKPLVSFIPLEQENYVLGKSAFNTGTPTANTEIRNDNEDISTYAASAAEEGKAILTSTISNLLPKKYAGVHSYLTPYNIKSDFCNFHIMNLIDNDYENLSDTQEAITETDLFDNDDSGKKIVNLHLGLQAIRIPISALKVDNVSQYGKYFIRISPKYIETTVQSVVESNVGEDLGSLNNNVTNSPEKKNSIALLVNKSDFENDGIWNFKNFPDSDSSISHQTNRLMDSVVEVYRNGDLIGTKTITGNDFNFSNSSVAPFTSLISLITLGPDLMGWDPAEEMIGSGDVLRIYPRETYFDPIIIDIDFVSKKQDFENLLRFLQNDTVRDINTNIVEVYNDEGITVDPESGQIDGTVIMRYQVGQTDVKEYRKTLKQS